ncbi:MULTISPECIES: hypothetical protein [Clostridium]|uniref:hypothetical protein n=1 Tax=Clostridium TaxID=1485 RepID=UPI00069DCB80|nr:MULTISPECIES: hypothetical protein [Clostridium]KOF56634.1 hypothetical protein AGR56_07845 [Clostridium sp. DMHC 10]MCD2348123.1 hypothetical protein [Clostridium guangxiense]
MNKKQRVLYKALEIISSATLTLEDAQNIDEELSVDEIQEVVNKFSKKITEFNVEELTQLAFRYQPYADNVITGIISKLNDI